MISPLVISGTGLFTPPESISNQELVEAFNDYVRLYNQANAEAIAAGRLTPLQESSAEFVLKASGIQQRYVMNRSGILDPEIMCPRLPERADDQPSIQCEMAVVAIREALAQAQKTPEELDAVLVACSNMQRPYPAMAVEIQGALGIQGFGFDLNVACASASFGIQTAADMIANGNARCVVVVNPEICTGHLNFRDRDSHFIFGDACTATIIERAATCRVSPVFQILGTKLQTQYSNNIRNNFGFLNRTHPETIGSADKLFVQQGRKVFKEVVPLAAHLILEHLEQLGLNPSEVRRFWLHQANLAMNQLISKKVLGRDATPEEAPTILDEYANTSSAGIIIAFHKYRDDLQFGDLGVLCAFGAGYSVGSVIVRKMELSTLQKTT